MTSWFRRAHDERPAPAPEPEDAADKPEALLQQQWQVVQFINRSAGKLPVPAVVIAREITDTIRSVIASAGDRDLDIYAVVTIKGILGDYLPTSLRTYLNLDPRLTEQVAASGRTPRAALREQLDSLAEAADDLLRATQEHDADAIFTQGNFLRTKFSRSDLDL
jgi:hypothetical protein